MFEFNATLIIAMISFVVFMFIMNAIFYRPILNIIRKRDELVAQNYQSAKEMANQADEINNEYQTKLNNAKAKGRENLSKEVEQIQKKYFKRTSEAKEKSKLEIQNNKDAIESQKIALYEEVNSSVIDDISTEILKKVMG